MPTLNSRQKIECDASEVSSILQLKGGVRVVVGLFLEHVTLTKTQVQLDDDHYTVPSLLLH